MPNIKQQKKRVRSAARPRLENLRYRFRDAADEGGTEADVEYKALVSWLDRAAARGAIHRNTAARRKAQAAKLLARKPS